MHGQKLTSDGAPHLTTRVARSLDEHLELISLRDTLFEVSASCQDSLRQAAPIGQSNVRRHAFKMRGNPRHTLGTRTCKRTT